MSRSGDLDEAVGQPFCIGPVDRDENICHAPSLLGRQVADLAEINNTKRVVFLKQQIAGMRVGMEYAALEGRLEHEADNAARDRCSARHGQVNNIRCLPSIDALLRENTVPGVLLDYARNLESDFVFEHIVE